MSSRRVAAGVRQAAKFRRLLLQWFDQHQRKLPWRGERDPYRILVSEIMLQQTRVAVVEDRYIKFVKQFPSAATLARARESTVLAAWSGLGYYRRARALHGAAKQVVRRGEFPRTEAELLELPGVGRYTAAAVASIAFGEPAAVVDGNVKRVVERLCASEGNSSQRVAKQPIAEQPMAEEDYWRIAGDLLDRRRAGDFNQAMMELGAMVCLPGQPLCTQCPVTGLCGSRGPLAKTRKAARQKAIVRYALVRRNGSVLLQQRAKDHSLMPGMWELPALDIDLSVKTEPLLKLRHSITTTDYTVLVHTASPSEVQGGRWALFHTLHRLPLTGLTRKIMEKLSHV